MIVITGDTHIPQRTREIPAQLLDDIREAQAVIHTGDFNSQDAYELIAGLSKKLYAVYGNRDEVEVEDILPDILEFEIDGLKMVLIHGHTLGRPRPSRVAREYGTEADFAIYGHLHHPFIVDFNRCTVLNPGSPVEPRGSRPSYIRASITGGSMKAEIVYL